MQRILRRAPSLNTSKRGWRLRRDYTSPNTINNLDIRLRPRFDWLEEIKVIDGVPEHGAVIEGKTG